MANLIHDERELEAVRTIAANHDLEIAAAMTFDETFSLAERAGMAPPDYNPDSPAIEPIGVLAEMCGEQWTSLRSSAFATRYSRRCTGCTPRRSRRCRPAMELSQFLAVPNTTRVPYLERFVADGLSE